MEGKNENRAAQEVDKHLDAPSEANTEKHINFLDVEDNDSTSSNKKSDELEERQKEWQRGIEEGKRSRDNS